MTDHRLQQIQALQFSDKPAAEAAALDFVREVFPDLDAQALELRPQAVSLNSFNGFLTRGDGKRLFFKTHVEPNSVVGEYYNSQMLADAGYPIIRPLHASTEYGKQFLIYDLIESPSVFDLMRAIERGESSDFEALKAAQNQADDLLLSIYKRTLEWQVPADAAKAPVHQLFYHRLGTRYDSFYREKLFFLPAGKGEKKALVWEYILARKWEINGVRYVGTLGEAIDTAREKLRPERAGWSVIGHGDAHNGNVFFTPNGLVYFDPAFGGRHHPLLDIAKPIFHNTFATWMYHPQEIAEALEITWHDDGKTIHVEHNYRPSDQRLMFFASKLGRVVWPFFGAKEGRAGRFADWRAHLKSALLCCPLLTMNLADRARFPETVGLLGLCYVVEMGLDRAGDGNSLLDRVV